MTCLTVGQHDKYRAEELCTCGIERYDVDGRPQERDESLRTASEYRTLKSFGIRQGWITLKISGRYIEVRLIVNCIDQLMSVLDLRGEFDGRSLGIGLRPPPTFANRISLERGTIDNHLTTV